MRQDKIITPHELAQHASRDDAWISVNGYVYNVTDFMRFHPGGFIALLKYAGEDATAIFNEIHDQTLLQNLEKFRIGRISHTSRRVILKSLKATSC